MKADVTYTATVYTQNTVKATCELREYDSLKAAKRGARILFDAHGDMAGSVDITGPGGFQITASKRNGTGMSWARS